MLVYRVEIDGLGVFYSGVISSIELAFSKRWVTDPSVPGREFSPYRHPCPEDDGFSEAVIAELNYAPYPTSTSWFFGCTSVAQIVHWFDSEMWRVELARLGGKIVVYEATQFEVGRTQVVFRKHTAKIVEEIPIPVLAP